MSEQQTPSSGFHADSGASAPSVADSDAEVFDITAGTYLRQSREAAGVHLASMAAALKVSVSKLEALEADQFDLLPSAVFTRALACSVCRMLKLDSVPVLERLPPIGPTPYIPKAGLNESFRPRNAGPAPSVWTQISRPAVLAGMLFLLGALVLIFLPSIRLDASTEKPVPESASDAPFPQEPVVLAQSEAPADVPGTEAGLPAGVAQPGLQPASAPTLTLALAPALAPASAAASGVTSTSAIASFRASGQSWINVTDGKGVVVLNRTLNAGETADVSGALPLSVVVGRADVTQVQVRGQAFDLATVSKSNVARFEVK